MIKNTRFFIAVLTVFLSSLTVAEESSIPDSSSKSSPLVTRRLSNNNTQQFDVARNIQLLSQLINHSASTRQINGSHNLKAKTLYEEAVKHLENARHFEAKGDSEAARNALTKARIKMFQAIRLSGQKDIKDKQQADYKRRIESTRALLEAHKAISKEKKLGSVAQSVEHHVSKELKKAQQAFQQGDFDKALEIANAAYLSIKISVSRLRNGDTLVRELHFDTKEDEYKYELERNNTHKILVNVLLKNKLTQKKFKLVQFGMQKAETLRQQAIEYAKHKKFEKAIATLEKSTQQIIRAIRMAGIFIPG